MKKTLPRSKTVEGDLAKLDKRLPRQSTFALVNHAAEFDYKRDTKHLCKVIKQCITAHTLDLDYILHFLSSYTCEQRTILVHHLDYEYHYKIVDMVLEQPESPMRSCTLAMLIEPLELYARDFHHLLSRREKGDVDGTLSRHCVEIILGLDQDETGKFKELYQQLFTSSLDDDVAMVFSDNRILARLLVQLLKGKRYDESNLSTSMAKIIAKKLHETGDGEPAIDYETMTDIFTRDAFSQLSAIFDIYEDKYRQPIQEAIDREFHGHIESKCFQDIAEFTRSPCGYYSRILRQVLVDQTPIDYRTLIRILIGHEEKDLREIKLEYSKVYDETLDQTIYRRVDIPEIKRLCTLIITPGQDLVHDDAGHVHFEHANNSHAIRTQTSVPTSNNASSGLRRNRSHEAFDKFVHVFKTMRPPH